MDLLKQRIETLTSEYLTATPERRDAIAIEVKSLKSFSDMLLEDAVKGSTRSKVTSKSVSKGRKCYSPEEVIAMNVGDSIAFKYAMFDKANPKREKQDVEAIFKGFIFTKANTVTVQLIALEVCNDVEDLERGKIYAFKLEALQGFNYLGSM